MNNFVSTQSGETELTQKDLICLKIKSISNRRELNWAEFENITKGMEWLSHQSPNTFDVFNIYNLTKLHKQLFGKVWTWAGKIRKTQTNIGVQYWEIRTYLNIALDDAKYWYENETYKPLEATIRFHHKLVWVHPFTNGNGRWSRIAADKYLEMFDSPYSINWFSDDLQQVDSKLRQEYIKGLKAADNENFQPLLSLFKCWQDNHSQSF